MILLKIAVCIVLLVFAGSFSFSTLRKAQGEVGWEKKASYMIAVSWVAMAIFMSIAMFGFVPSRGGSGGDECGSGPWSYDC